MVRPEFKDRFITTYFGTREEKKYWESFAEDRGKSLSRLIPEALAALKDRETSLPRPDLLAEIESLKEELRECKHELKIREELLRRYESELYKIKHAGFEEDAMGMEIARRYDLHLIQLLKSGKTLEGSDILASLGIGQDDRESANLVWKQLENLQKFGLVHETRFGWKWSR